MRSKNNTKKRLLVHPKLVKKALKRFGGSQTKLAEAMQKAIDDANLKIGPVRQGHVGNWEHARRVVSPHMALFMGIACENDVTLFDFYPEFSHATDRAA